MATNGTLSDVAFTDTILAGSTLIKAIHLNELNDAINTLNTLKSNVNNCDCSVCTSNCCQTCQSNCTCESSGGCSCGQH